MHSNSLGNKVRRLLFALGLGLGLILTVLAVAGRLTPIFAAKPEDQTGGSAMGRFEPAPATQQQVDQTLGKLPLRFIPNVGQIDPEAHFTVKGNGQTLFFTDQEVVFVATGKNPPEMTDPVEKTALVHLYFPGANPHPTVEGLEPLTGVVNYFYGNDSTRWRANVSTYGALIYRELYPGIDLVYRGTAGRLKSEFHLVPGADPDVIRLAYRGAESAHLSPEGTLVLRTALGELIEAAPFIYQVVAGIRRSIPGEYVLLPGPARAEEILVGFRLGPYDLSQPVVIDPELAFSTYLGGSDGDLGHDIAVDDTGNIYVTGVTGSPDFPSFNELQPGRSVQEDVFVTKIISAGGVYTYDYSTYLDGSNYDHSWGIAVDDAGNAYVTGWTESDDFPTYNEVQTDQPGTDAFMVKIINASGVYTFAYATYLGGDQSDLAWSITADNAGNAYVTGYTGSTDFPTYNEIQTDQPGTDAFVTKIINANGVYTYGYSTYLGGKDSDDGLGIAVDDAGRVYVTGGDRLRRFPCPQCDPIRPAGWR